MAWLPITEIEKTLRLLRSHGTSKNKETYRQMLRGLVLRTAVVRIQHRLTDIAASLGIAQVKKLDRFIKTRRKIRDRYTEELKNLNCKIIQEAKGTESSVHLILMLTMKYGHRDRIFRN